MPKSHSGPGCSSIKAKNTVLRFLTQLNKIPEQCHIEEHSAKLQAMYVWWPQANCETAFYYM